ncbi:MAG TPA: 5-formyltetrahydrofolate cyclo-ligase [Polyangiaceae bacterium]|nr:5-formyltetrahydrofolate cyclo-ligase [Polyangiaceae bacterium]
MLLLRAVDPFDPKVVLELSVRAKQQLRRRARATRKAHAPASLAERSARLVPRILTHGSFEQARSVGLFWPMIERGEVDVRPLDAAARAAGKAVFYPFLQRSERGVRTGFRLTSAATELVLGVERFAQPAESALEAKRGDVDLVIVPALAVAGDGHRLGYGMGFYDATLPDVCPPARTIAVAYDFELLAELPSEPHDVRCDVVITDVRTLEPA